MSEPEQEATSPPPPTPPGRDDETRGALTHALDALMAAMPPEQARAVSLSAVPHWLDEDLLADLLGGGGGESDVLSLVRPLRFVTWEPDGRFRVHDAARTHLRQRLRAEEPEVWRAANAAAVEHFRRRSVRTAGGGAPVEEVEALYHRLAIDELGGLDELAHLFDDAVWNHQIGLAERYVRVAAEQESELSANGRAWIDYYQARLAQLLHTGDGGVAALSALAAQTSDPRLSAAARLGLARAAIAGHRWHEAADLLRTGHAALLKSGGARPEDLARLELATGDVFRDLAARSGGAEARQLESGGWWRLRLLPFLGARGMVRRLRWAPNWWWWHAGADYSDWIVAWLLERAQGWYGRAAIGFGGDDVHGRVDAAAAMADTQRQLGRWAAAREGYTGLLADDDVAGSPYATARAALGLGMVSVETGAVQEARNRLDDAAAVFRRFGDMAGSAAAAMASAELAERSGSKDEAVAAYAAAVPVLAAARDRLALSEVDARLDAAMDGGGLSDTARRAAAEARAAIVERHYLARFSGAWLIWFRRLAIYVAAPLTFVVGTLLLAFALMRIVAVVETEVRLVALGQFGLLSVPDHLMTLLWAAGLALIALWLFPFVYGLGGMMLVRLLGRGLERIERDQPARVVLTEEGIGLADAAGERYLDWSAIVNAATADLRLRRRPILLLSRTAVVDAAGRPLLIEGITSHYTLLQDELRRRLEGRTPLVRHDLTLLEPKWVLATLAAAALLVVSADRMGLVPAIGAAGSRAGAGEAIDLTLTYTMPLVFLFVTFVLGLAVVSHWRLAAHARRLRRALPPGLAPGSMTASMLIVAALGWTAVGVYVVTALLSSTQGLE